MSKPVQFWLLALAFITFLWVFLNDSVDIQDQFADTNPTVDSRTPQQVASRDDPEFKLDLIAANNAVPTNTIERAAGQPDNVHFGIERIMVATPRGRVPLNVAIADTPLAMQFGLMNRRNWPAGVHGMLFLLGKGEERAMWMHNTYIPLDILFLNNSGEIISIAENTKPLSETSIPSRGLATGALEIPAGSAKSWQLQRGNRIEHPFFSGSSH